MRKEQKIGTQSRVCICGEDEKEGGGGLDKACLLVTATSLPLTSTTVNPQTQTSLPSKPPNPQHCQSQKPVVWMTLPPPQRPAWLLLLQLLLLTTSLPCQTSLPPIQRFAFHGQTGAAPEGHHNRHVTADKSGQTDRGKNVWVCVSVEQALLLGNSTSKPTNKKCTRQTRDEVKIY
jgi:hypothetical protein